MKRIALICLIVFSSGIFNLLRAQQNDWVSVSLNVTPPYPIRLTDLSEQPGKVIIRLQNKIQRPVKIYLRAAITGSNGISAITDPSYIPPIGIDLSANQLMLLDFAAIRDLFDVNHLKFSGITLNEIIRKQGLPEGEYQICVRAYLKDQPTLPISSAAPFGCANFRLTALEPPFLIRPAAEEQIKIFQPQNVIFSWSIPPGAPAGTRYRLRIVEMLDSKRNVNDAMLSATNPAFFEKTVQGNIYVYGPADPPLVEGRKYAWAVTALDEFLQERERSSDGTSFRNNGRSEVRGFVVQKTELPQYTDAGQGKPKAKGSGEKGFKPNLKASDLNVTTIKGRLLYAYRKTEKGLIESKPAYGTFNVAEANTKNAADAIENSGVGFVSLPFANAENLPTQQQEAKGKPSAKNKASINVFGSGQIGTIQMVDPVTLGVVDHQQQLQEKIIALADDNHYPLAHTDVELDLYIDPKLVGKMPQIPGVGSKNGSQAKAHIYLGKVRTDQDGNFSFNYYGETKIGYLLTLGIHNPYFEFADIGIQMVSDTNGVYNVGEMLGIAKTYRLKVKVVDEEGTILETAKVSILRRGDFYNKNAIQASLEHEVLRDQFKDSVDQDAGRQQQYKLSMQNNAGSLFKMELIGKANQGSTFTRLFVGDNWNDAYYVRVSLDSNISKTYTHYVQGYPGGYIENGVPVIEKTFVLPLPNPIVSGRVVSKTGGIPIKDAIVIVKPKKESGAGVSFWDVFSTFTAKTDAQGNFRVENIIPSSTPYTVSVQYKSKTYEQPQLAYLTKKGIAEERNPIELPAVLIGVCGKIQDTEGAPVANATLRWKNGGDVFYSDENGQFITAQTEGKHLLISMSPGFKDREVEIDVKVPKSKGAGVMQLNETNYNTNAENWQNTVFNNALSGGKIGSKDKQKQSNTGFYKMTGVGGEGAFDNGVTFGQALFSQVYKNAELVASGSLSCDHVITMTKFYVKANVKDASNGMPVKNATIKVEGGTKQFNTDNNGFAVLSDVPSGSPKLITQGPADALYETVSNIITVNNSQDTIYVEIALKAGSKVTGKVSTGTNPVKDAEVFVEGRKEITAKTDSEGAFTLLGVPAGEYKIVASKSGFLSDDSSMVFEANKQYVIDFKLKDPGFNATSLYGFPIALDDSKPGLNPNEFIIKGRIVDFPDNPVFKKSGVIDEMKFADLVIVKDGSTIYAKNGEVKLDVSEIPLTVLGYLKVKLQKGDGLVIKPIGGDKSKGEIIGEVAVDLINSFSMLVGWQAPSLPIKLQLGTELKIGAITSNGMFNAAGLKIGSSATEFKLYSVTFKPDWPNCTIGSNGFGFKGSIKVDGVPLLSAVTLLVNKLEISKNGKVTDVDISVDPKPEISILTWKLKVNTIQLNNSGLKFGGNMSVAIPGSSNASIGFNSLVISGSGITGGSFFMPDAGLDIFGLLKFKAPAGTMFSLQKIPASSHYKLIGAGTFSLPKLIKKELELKNFSIATNGDFAVTAKTDFTVGFADMANLTINTIGFDIGKKQVDIGGNFKLNIPGFGVGAAGVVHYKPGSVWLDELGVGFKLSSAVEVAVKVGFKNENEFSGDGYLKLAGLIDGVGLGFSYKKLSGGVEVGATFKTGFVIPIGVVKLDKLGGGFNLNTSTSVYTVFASGRITLAPDPAGIVALDPVKLTITSTPAGPTLLGEATVVALTSWSIGKAELKVDYPNRLFYIDGKFGGGFSLMKGLSAEASAGIHIEAGTAGSPYWFVSGYSKTSIAGVFNTGVTIVGGWNAAKSEHPTLSSIPDFALYNGRVYGGYFATSSHIGGNSPEIDIIGLAAVSGWYNADGNVEVYANFKSSSFGLKFSQSWSAGGSARIYKLGDIASASISVSGNINGNYAPSGWGIGGNLSGSIHAHLGCNGGCGISWGCCFDPCFWDSCEVCPCPCGVKVCASASVSISYSSSSGFDFDLTGF